MKKEQLKRHKLLKQELLTITGGKDNKPPKRLKDISSLHMEL